MYVFSWYIKDKFPYKKHGMGSFMIVHCRVYHKNPLTVFILSQKNPVQIRYISSISVSILYSCIHLRSLKPSD